MFVGCISDFHGVASDHRDKSYSLFDFMYGVSHTDHSVKTCDNLKTVSVEGQFRALKEPQKSQKRALKEPQ